MDEVYLDITYYSNSLYLLANKKHIYDLYLYIVSLYVVNNLNLIILVLSN